MKTLGCYKTEEGERYILQFVPEHRRARAFGPISNAIDRAVSLNTNKPAFEVEAKSEEEARHGLAREIGQGSFTRDIVLDLAICCN